MLTSLIRVFVSIRATFGCGFSCVNAYFSWSSFWSGTVRVFACDCVRVRARVFSKSWMDGPCLSTRVEFHFIEKKKQEGWMGEGRGGGDGWKLR